MPSTTSSDDLCGSGQSLESIAKDQAAQPKLLAAAAARKSSFAKPTGAIGKRKITGMPKRFFTYKKPEMKTGDDAKRRKGHKDKPAFLKFSRCTYQKGEKATQLSGHVRMSARSRWTGKGCNETFKTKVNDKLLLGPVRWNTASEGGSYTARVNTVEEAILVREAMKMVSEQDENDLNESGPTDEDIAAVFDFEEAKSTTITIVKQFTVNDEIKKAIAGDSYPFKDHIKDAGFSWNPELSMWLAPPDTETEDLEAMMTEYGFEIDSFDDGEAVDA